MASQYAPKTFIRRADNELLRKYLYGKGVGQDLEWESLKKRDIDPIFNAIETAPDGIRAQIERDFQTVHGLGTEGGRKTIVGLVWDDDEIMARLDGMKDNLDVAFWIFTEHGTVFEEASLFYAADSISNWRKVKDLPNAEPVTGELSGKLLEAALSEYFVASEGRGHICKVDYYSRGPQHYWFAYPEDYSGLYAGFDDKGEFDFLPQKPAFEIVFVHDPDDRSLNVYIKGQQKVAADVQRIWAEKILNEEIEIDDEVEQVYELQGLLDRDFAFPTDPEDGVYEVRVKKLRLDINPGQKRGEKRRITVEADSGRTEHAVYDLLENILAGKQIPVERLKVSQACIRITWKPEGGKRGKTLTFEVSVPNSCSLKCEPRHEIAKRFLKEWGIDVSGHPKQDPQES
jgi:hypothetical protein